MHPWWLERNWTLLGKDSVTMENFCSLTFFKGKKKKTLLIHCKKKHK